MPRSKSNTFCPYCHSIVPAGKTCACRKRDGMRKVLEPWRTNYHDRNYQKNRQVVIERQHGRCIDCATVCAEWDGMHWKTKRLGGEVDHILPLSKGGTNAPENLALRCQSCHRRADARRRG